MTNCQNNFHLLFNIPMAKAILTAFALAIFLGMIIAPSRAQQNAPVNLLKIAPINANAHSLGNPDDIDQLVDSDSATVELRDKQQTEETTKVLQQREITVDIRKGDQSAKPRDKNNTSAVLNDLAEEKKDSNIDEIKTEVAVDGLVIQNSDTDGAGNGQRNASTDASGAFANYRQITPTAVPRSGDARFQM